MVNTTFGPLVPHLFPWLTEIDAQDWTVARICTRFRLLHLPVN